MGSGETVVGKGREVCVPVMVWVWASKLEHVKEIGWTGDIVCWGEIYIKDGSRTRSTSSWGGGTNLNMNFQSVIYPQGAIHSLFSVWSRFGACLASTNNSLST